MNILYLKNLNPPDSYILIKEGRINKVSTLPIEENLEMSNVEEIDLTGKTVIPGLIDMQVHLREPGFEYKENIQTGTAAAAKGGFTTIACMPNTSPTIDNDEVLENVMQRCRHDAKVEVIIVPAMTKNLQGKEVVDLSSFKKHGVIAITDDGRGVQDDNVMKNIFIQAGELGLSVLQHCEFDSLSKGASLHRGRYSEQNNLEGIPSESEWKMVKRDIEILKQTGGRAHYHVLHASCKETIELVKQAKKQGLNVTVEVTPHHLLLCDEDIPQLNPNFKMNPPLRSREDQHALCEALVAGDIDMISTDHAPHSPEEKSHSFEEAPFGIVGLETAFALIYNYFVENKKITLDQLIELMSLAPQRIFKIPRGEVREGALADLTIIDTNKKNKVIKENFVSKSENSPFIGWELKGWPVMTIKEGRVIYQDR